MNEVAIANIRPSWEVLAASALKNMMLFYDKLFEIAPKARPLFADDISQQSEKPGYTISFVMTNIDRLDPIKESAEDLGSLHNKLDIKAEHYPPVKEARVWTIKEKMGDAYKEEIGDAWNGALDFVASIMSKAPAKRENRRKSPGYKLFGK